eukprot:363445-Chlamydomonas_euryale.AAC.4
MPHTGSLPVLRLLLHFRATQMPAGHAEHALGCARCPSCCDSCRRAAIQLKGCKYRCAASGPAKGCRPFYTVRPLADIGTNRIPV